MQYQGLSMVRIDGECQAMAQVMDWYSIKWAHWQKESLDFSLWISPLPGEIFFVVYFLFIDFGFPLCQCVIDHLVSTTSEGCPYNILIYSDNIKQHQEHTWEILQWLQKHSLYAKACKCKWHQQTVKFLGYILSTNSLSMTKDKVKAICNWPEPQSVKDIQSFLNFTNFYHCFIQNYMDSTIPLTQLTQKDTPWNFMDECHASFDYLKKAFTSAPVLTHWQPNQQLVMETDVSDYAPRAILSIHKEDGALHLVTFHSWSFMGAM